MFPRAATAAILSVPFQAYALYYWKESEKTRIRALAEELAHTGMVKVKCSSHAEKLKAWKSYLPKIAETWNKVKNSTPLDLKNDTTWPDPETGRAHEYTHKGVLDYPIKVWSDHYESQATVLAFLDSQLDGRSNWGSQTHWRLRLLLSPAIFPTYLIFPELLPDVSSDPPGLQIAGDDNSWGISLFPVKGSRKHAGDATPQHAHFDGGRGGVFERGFPFAIEKSTWLSADELDDALLQVLSAQLAIQIYALTPGEVSASRGATGVYVGSHLVVAGALRRALEIRQGPTGENVPNTPTSSGSPTIGAELSSGNAGLDPNLSLAGERASPAISYQAIMATLKRHSRPRVDHDAAHKSGRKPASSSSSSSALGGLLIQPALESDSMLLMAGLAVHGTMFAEQPMDVEGLPTPRVIMNAKSFVASSREAMLSGDAAKVLKHATENRLSLARVAVLDPQKLWVESGGSIDEFKGRVEVLANEFARSTK